MGKCWATLVIRGAGQLRRKMLRSQQCKQQHLLLLVSLSLLRTSSNLRCKRGNIAEQAFIWDFFFCVCARVKISKEINWFPRVRLKGMFAHKYFLIGTGTWKWFCYVRSISFIDAMKKVCLLISLGSCNSHLSWLGFLAAKLLQSLRAENTQTVRLWMATALCCEDRPHFQDGNHTSTFSVFLLLSTWLRRCLTQMQRR